MRRFATGTGLVLSLALIGSAVAAPPDEVRRLRGIIDKDETWSGTVLITDNLSIVGATVRVSPGTVIEFAGGNPSRRPVLTVGAEPNPIRREGNGNLESLVATGRLEMQGTADRPIIVRTAEKSGAGRIAVTVRNVTMPAKLEAGKIAQSAPATQEADRLQWRHVRFERLGHMERRREMSRDVEFWQPCVQILIRKGRQEASLENCAFRECAHLLVVSDEECDVSIRGCRFENPTDPSSVKLLSLDENTTAKSIRFVDNFVAGMLTLSAGPCEAINNRFIGHTAGIAVRPESTGAITLDSNYVHCTDEGDKDRYVLTVERPDAVVQNNVLIGGAYVVYQGSRRMSGNVLVAAQRLSNDKGGKARTRRLVRSLPAGSIFEDNVLIGPALALIGPQRPLRPERGAPNEANKATVVRHNVLDGFDGQTRALQLGLPRADGGAVEFYDNLVYRCGPMVADSTIKSDGIAFADYNAIVAGPEKLFQGAVVAGLRAGEEGWSKHDQRFDAADGAGLVPVPESPIEIDQAIISSSLTVADARRRITESYRVRRDSPLVGAGRPVGGRRGDIGLFVK